MRATTTLLAGALLLAGCGGSSLAVDDPDGYEACRLYVKALKSDDQVVRMGLPMFEVGKHASEAETPEIRDAVTSLWGEDAVEAAKQSGSDMPDAWLVDDDALTTACEANGVKIP